MRGQNFEQLISNNASFGKKNRPQTPVKGIISGDYGNQAEKEIVNKYTNLAEEKITKKQVQNVGNTRARQLAAEHIKNA